MEMVQTHELKLDPLFYNHVVKGDKTFEIRKNDRNYQVGDIIRLRPFDRETSEYVGDNVVTKRVTYITNYEQKDDFVVLGLGEVHGHTL